MMWENIHWGCKDAFNALKFILTQESMGIDLF